MGRKPTPKTPEVKTAIVVTAEDTNELAEMFLKMSQVLERMSGIPLKQSKPAARVRDPLEPKRPMTPYLLFSREHRNEIRQADPDAPSQTIAKRVGDAWKNLSQEERDVYIAEHRVLRADYKRRVAEYEAQKEKAATSVGNVVAKINSTLAGAASSADSSPEESADGDSSSEEEEEEEEEEEP
ncbi:hypothetical protein EC988_002988, partial [Linderina pennispora]